MKRSGIMVTLVSGALLTGAAPTPTNVPKNNQKHYEERELRATPMIKQRLQLLRRHISERSYAFQVGYTTAMNYRLDQLAGLVPPPDLARHIRSHKESVAAKISRAPVAKITANTCSAGSSSFDWRKFDGSTPVRDQLGCGSCWAFATHAAFEGAYAIRNNFKIDSSEQDTLDCNSSGWDCGGGWWAHQHLIDKGTARESSYSYTGIKGTCRADVSRRYKAEIWDYVSSASIPSISEMKQALCDHGPLAIAVNVTSAFVSYTGGVFDACAQSWRPSTDYVVGDLVQSASGYMYECTRTGRSGSTEPSWPVPPPSPVPDVIDASVVWSYRGMINHGISLIGWDDGKQAWLIKNSWGTGWGEAGGYGAERGYMWIRYGCNNVGLGASWVRPSPCTNKCSCN